MQASLLKKPANGMKQSFTIKRSQIPVLQKSVEMIWPKFINGWQIIIHAKGIRTNAAKYIAIGKSKYPHDIFYDELTLDELRKNGPKDSLFAKYEQINKEYPDSAIYFFNYGLELYQYATDTSTGKRVANSDDLIKKAQDKLLTSVKLNPNYPQSYLVLGQISYNEGVEFQVLGKTQRKYQCRRVEKTPGIPGAGS